MINTAELYMYMYYGLSGYHIDVLTMQSMVMLIFIWIPINRWRASNMVLWYLSILFVIKLMSLQAIHVWVKEYILLSYGKLCSMMLS